MGDQLNDKLHDLQMKVKHRYEHCREKVFEEIAEAVTKDEVTRVGELIAKTEKVLIKELKQSVGEVIGRKAS